MSIKRLFDDWLCHLGPLPDDYLVLDIETSGLCSSTDYILQIGHCLVQSRCVVSRSSVFLNWAVVPGRHGFFNQFSVKEIQHKLLALEYEFYKKNIPFHTPWQRVEEEGVDPFVVLKFYDDWIQELRSSGGTVVTHNGYSFDCRFLTTHFQRFLGSNNSFGDDLVIDTGSLIKGAQIQFYPRARDTRRSYSMRVREERRKGILWSLTGFSVPTLELDKKYHLEELAAHDASYDSYVTHLLFDELKQRHRKMCSHASLRGRN